MKHLNFSLISKYRQMLMGIAILGVLIGHWFSLSGQPANNTILRTMNIIPRLVFTQGFLLLSGFGLYYSFCKNGDVKAFYKKRFDRLLIPFIIMICPFLTYYLMVGDINGWQFLGRMTSISYWIYGNYYGMWYIALSVVLYLMYPIIHKAMMIRGSFVSVTLVSILLLMIFVAVTRTIQSLSPDYYQIHNHAFNGAFMFAIGMYLSYLSKQEMLRQQLGGGFCSFYFAYLSYWNDMKHRTTSFVKD